MATNRITLEVNFNFSSLFAVSRERSTLKKILRFAIFYLRPTLTILLTIIITFYAFNNFSLQFPCGKMWVKRPRMEGVKYEFFPQKHSHSRESANEMKILRKINFFMQIFLILCCCIIFSFFFEFFPLYSTSPPPLSQSHTDFTFSPFFSVSFIPFFLVCSFVTMLFGV